MGIAHLLIWIYSEGLKTSQMSLTYFEDADLQPLPKIYHKIDWDNIKKFICQQVESYTNNN